MDAQWGDMLRLLGSRRPALLDEIADEVQESGGEVDGGRVDHAFRQQLLAADDATRTSLVQEYIRQELARIMGIEPAEPGNGSAAEHVRPRFAAGAGVEEQSGRPARFHAADGQADGRAEHRVAGRGDGAVVERRCASRRQTADRTPTLNAPRNGRRCWRCDPAGSRPPLLLLPALGGDVRCYADLVQQLGEDQPVYAFRPRGVDQDLPPHLTMDEMIADYLAAVRELQPTGPYHLAGWSAGGIFAFALAEALERAGEEVALIAMFDAPLPSICDDVDVEDDARFLCDLVNFAARFSGRRTSRSITTNCRDLRRRSSFNRRWPKRARAASCRPRRPSRSFADWSTWARPTCACCKVIEPKPTHDADSIVCAGHQNGAGRTLGRTPPSDEDLGWSSRVGQAVELA